MSKLLLPPQEQLRKLFSLLNKRRLLLRRPLRRERAVSKSQLSPVLEALLLKLKRLRENRRLRSQRLMTSIDEYACLHTT